MTAIWAHRGAHKDLPENTIPAFAKALDLGVDGIEIDVHLTSDGELVVHHDESLTASDGSKLFIRDLSAADVASFDLGGGITPPTLSEVFDLLRPTNAVLNVEVKNGQVIYEGIEASVAAACTASGMVDRIVISSFNHFSLKAIQQLAPELELAPLYSEGLVDPWLYVDHLGMPGVHPYVANLFAPGVAEGFSASALKVRPWTVNGPELITACLNLGLDTIVTDDIELALRLREEHQQGA